MALESENSVIIEGDQATLTNQRGSEFYIRSGSQLEWQTFQHTRQQLQLVAESLRINTSWDRFGHDQTAPTACKRMVTGRCRLNPGLQVLGDRNSYSEEIKVELWSDAQAERWNDLLRMSQLFEDTGFSNDTLRNVSASLSYRGSNINGEGNWSIAVKMPEQALWQIQRALLAFSLERVSFSLQFGKAYVLDEQTYLKPRQTWETFRDQRAFFMLNDQDDNECKFWGEASGLLIATEEFRLPQKRTAP